MDKERTKIDQKLCDTVKMMLAGKDAKVTQVVELLGISQATVNRIRQAGYSLEQFEKDKKDRNQRKKELKAEKVGSYGCVYTGTCELPRPGIELTPEGPIDRETIEAVRDELTKEIPGQISMDLQPAEEQKQGMDDQAKMMRFFAGQIAKVTEKLEKLNDTMSQILRRMDK